MGYMSDRMLVATMVGSGRIVKLDVEKMQLPSDTIVITLHNETGSYIQICIDRYTVRVFVNGEATKESQELTRRLERNDEIPKYAKQILNSSQGGRFYGFGEPPSVWDNVCGALHELVNNHVIYNYLVDHSGPIDITSVVSGFIDDKSNHGV